MGMTASLRAIDSATFQNIQQDPEMLESLYGCEDEDVSSTSVDIDKAWHGIHFLLNGQASGGVEPLSLVIFGGETIGDPFDSDERLLTPGQVQEIADALRSLDQQTLTASYQPQAMKKAEIYPDIWVRDGQDALDYLLAYFDQLKAFYLDAAARGDGVLISIG